jgi:hypothetical protein
LNTRQTIPPEIGTDILAIIHFGNKNIETYYTGKGVCYLSRDRDNMSSRWLSYKLSSLIEGRNL